MSTALHQAAAAGDAAAVEHLLGLAPDPAAAAAAADGEGNAPAHHAAAGDTPGHVQALKLLLAAAPETALAANHAGGTPIFEAIVADAAEAVQALLECDPRTATSGSDRACLMASSLLPIHVAATAGGGDTVRLLLQAAPASATAPTRDGDGQLPLHLACASLNYLTAPVLASAAPGSVSARNAHGRSPVGLMVPAFSDPFSFDRAAATGVRMSVAAGDARPLLRALAGFRQPTSVWRDREAELTRVARWIVCSDLAQRKRLSPEEWALVPAPCPGLEHALPAALERSVGEAALLVARLEDSCRSRLRAAACTLTRVQRQLGLELPTPVAWKILARCTR